MVPILVKVAKKKLKFLKIFFKNYKTKDGTGVRDYIHIMDLADGHVAMIKNRRLTRGLKIYNFGTGKGSTVLDVVKAFEKKNKISVSYKFTKRRKGDIAISFCDPSKAKKELNWKAKFGLDQSMLDIKI